MTSPSDLLARATRAAAIALLAALFAASVAVGEPNVAVTEPVVTAGNGSSRDIRFDRNGRFAVYISDANNLVAGQSTAGLSNVFIYDRLSGTTRLVSHVPGNPLLGGNAAVALVIAPQISADGRWVAYASAATDLVAGQDDTNAATDVFLWEAATGTTVLASRRAGTTAAAGSAASRLPDRQIAISGDGRYLVFASLANNLIAGQATNAEQQIYLFDRQAGAIALVSHASTGVLNSAAVRSEFPSGSEGNAISADGRWVVFNTLATNHVAGVTDSNGNFDIYLWDRDAPLATSLRLLSRTSAPLTAGNALSDQPSVSANGKFVSFTSRATNLEGVTTDSNSASDVFRYDREANLLELVSHRVAGLTATANADSIFPVIDAAGDLVAYQSKATNLAVLQNDSNGAEDVFVWRGTQNLLWSRAAGTTSVTGNGASLRPLLAPDGAVAFSSAATDLVTGVVDTNGQLDAFVRPRGNAATVLLSHVPSEAAAGNNQSFPNDVGLGGAFVAYATAARDLVDTPINGNRNMMFHGSLVMSDGFESGDLSAWSQHFP